MTASETQYFTLLRSALWDTPVVIDGPVDWNGVMELAKHHSNQVLVCGVASQMTGDNRPSEAMLGQMQAAMRNNLLSQMRLKQILSLAVGLLRQHDIEPVLLKGFGLAMLCAPCRVATTGERRSTLDINTISSLATIRWRSIV